MGEKQQRGAAVAAAGPVTCRIRRLEAGEQTASQKLREGYCRRLVGLVRKRLQGASRYAADEESGGCA